MATPLPATESQFADFRTNNLLPLITSGLVESLFHTLTFSYTETDENKQPVIHQVSIRVSEPVSVPFEGTTYYVPVTPPETFSLAKACGAVPLTRAISDRAFNKDGYFKRTTLDANKTADKPDFVRFAKFMETKYLPQRTLKLVSGAHKIWMLSAAGKAGRGVNHGFHIPKAEYKHSLPTPSLDPAWSVIQNQNADHDKDWWDYSQLLQMMKDLTVDGKKVDLLDAIESGHAAVWDEQPGKIRSDQQLLIDPLGPVRRHARVTMANMATYTPAIYMGLLRCTK
jgi:hypothetical protein